MAKPNLKKLREDFDSLLKDVWRVWEEARELSRLDEDDEEHLSEKFGNSPFDKTEWTWESTMSDQERENLREDRGWLLGVAAATGWRLDSGPREWSPR